MFFQKLAPNIQEAIKGLTKDKKFQETFGKDPVLDELDEEKFNPAECFIELKTALNHRMTYNGKSYNNITPLLFSFLWCIQSPIVVKTSTGATQADYDLFFYLLEAGITDEEISETAKKAFGFCEANGISQEDQVDVINMLYNIAFKPLRMFPETKAETNTICAWDADWLFSMITKVQAVTGYSPDFIMSKMSLTSCCLYYVQYARMQGANNIERLTNEEILKAQSERTCQLICDRLIELGVITPEERQEVYTTMTTPIENNK